MKRLSIDLRVYWVCLTLFLGTLLLFSRVVAYDFVDFDDPDYVTQNGHVQAGLTWAGVCWAFQTETAGNWHPLTWVSLMADRQLFGKPATGPHAVNVVLHALNAVLAFLVLRRLTGWFWASAGNAALFAWHPLRVESVAWIAERKDLLCGLFCLLTLLTYVHYVAQPGGQRRARLLYGLTFLFFICGLMSKPMLVTLPFLLLLLDFWPLKRIGPGTLPRRLYEKVPFVMAAAAVCLVTYSAQKDGGAIVESLSLGLRLENALMAVTGYLAHFFWPFNLAVPYALPDAWPVGQVVCSAWLMLTLSGLALWQWRRRPGCLTGWLWFLGMLVPVIGLVQAGHQALADRYTYLPILGWQLALLGTLHPFQFGDLFRRVWLSVAAVVLLGCGWRTWDQEAVWQNSHTLHAHALAVTDNNYLAESDFATTLLNEQKFTESESYFRRAIAIHPGFAVARFKLALELEAAGRPDDALTAYAGLLQIRPHDADAHYNSGVILLNRGQMEDAIGHFQAAVASQNNYVSAYVGLGLAEMQTGRLAAAVASLRQAEQLAPDFPGLRAQLAEAQQALAAAGQTNAPVGK